MEKLLEKKLEILNSYREISKSTLNRIYENSKIDYVYNSNAIEGNSLTGMETKVVIEQGITIKGKPLKDHIEAKNQAYAVDFLRQEVKKKLKIDKRTIKEFHQIVIGDIDRDIAGKFRKVRVEISSSEVKTSEPYHIEEDLDKLLKWYESEKEKDQIEKIAIFHAEFERIHPFEDGNGRTGRLLMNLDLMKLGYPITIIRKEDRLDYYKSLEIAQVKKNYSEIIKFIRDNVERNLEKILDLLEENWRDKL